MFVATFLLRFRFASRLPSWHPPQPNSSERLVFVAMVPGERASETKQDDASTRLEGAEINKSLLALKECAHTALHDGHWPEAAF